METTRITLPKITLIGKCGSSKDGKDFVRDLWTELNKNFSEISYLAKWDESGALKGLWGAMSDESLSFKPWEGGYENGLYLAGVEAVDDAVAPSSWTKWVIPSFEYIKAKVESTETFKELIGYLIANKINLVGSVQNFTNPKTNENFLMFPIRKVEEEK